MTNIELPKDAEGREIPLDTSKLFISDGTMVHVLRFEYMYHTHDTHDAHDAWFVYIERTPGEHMTLHACDVHLTPPDSWEQLEEDLTAFDDGQIYGPCHYFHELGDDCMSCPARDDACADAVMRDVASRIRKLRDEVDE